MQWAAFDSNDDDDADSDHDEENGEHEYIKKEEDKNVEDRKWRHDGRRDRLCKFVKRSQHEDVDGQNK